MMDETHTRLFVISNRLPVTVKPLGKGKYDFKMSSGGLVTGLSGLSKSTKFQWFGWPGIEVPKEDIESLKSGLEEQHDAVPIFLDSDLAERHYNGFSNSILWPLFHYFPDKMSFDESSGKAYHKVNELFADAVAPYVRDGDLIWVHDYHLMLLPLLLRQRLGDSRKGIKIGFFLHTPFPAADFFTILPGRKEILEGLLSCDLTGFHTEEYSQHFVETCSRVLGLKCQDGAIEYKGRHVKTGAFPIGIEPEEFRAGLASEQTQQTLEQLSNQFRGMNVMVGVDRMDYIKGVPQKLHALDRFFTTHPEWKGKTILIQVAVPSRDDVEEYQKLRHEVNGLVGKVTGKHGTVAWSPIHFMHKSISKDELIALYAISDVCLVSSTRDGMNLVSYEYVACQDDRKGVLVISKYAGAAQTLPDCFTINPWDTDEFAETIHQALTMDEEERARRHEKAGEVVNELTSFYWGRIFLEHLKEA